MVPSGAEMRSWLKRNQKWGLRLGVMGVLLFVFAKWVNLPDSVSLIGRADVFFLCAALLFVFGIHAVKAVRFYVLAHHLGVPVSGLKNIAVHALVPLLGRVTPAKIGEGFKIFLVPEKKQVLSFCFVLEKLVDSLVLLGIALIGVLQFKQFVNAYLILGGMVIVGIFIVFKIDRIVRFIAKRNVLEEKWFGNYLRKISILQWSVFLLLSGVVSMGILVIPVFVNVSLQQDVPVILTFQLWALAMIIGIISALPGGFGAREIGYTALLMQFASLSKEIAGIAAALVILVNVFGESVLAVIGMLMNRSFSFDDKVSDESKEEKLESSKDENDG